MDSDLRREIILDNYQEPMNKGLIDNDNYVKTRSSSESCIDDLSFMMLIDDDIIKDIDAMDADIITFEASRSKLEILDALKEVGFETESGPGVYDIHSPRVPSVEEIVGAIRKMLEKIPKEKLWVNPDCGLKTRGIPETEASLKNMVAAAKIVREELK